MIMKPDLADELEEIVSRLKDALAEVEAVISQMKGGDNGDTDQPRR